MQGRIRIGLIVICLSLLAQVSNCLAYYGLYQYTSPYSSYGYPYSSYGGLGLYNSGWIGNYGLSLGNLYNPYALSNIGLFGLGGSLFNLGQAGWPTPTNSGFYGLANLGLIGGGSTGWPYGVGLSNPYLNLLGIDQDTVSQLYDDLTSSGLNAYGLQLVTNGGLGYIGLQSLLLSALLSQPVSNDEAVTNPASTNVNAEVYVPLI